MNFLKQNQESSSQSSSSQSTTEPKKEKFSGLSLFSPQFTTSNLSSQIISPSTVSSSLALSSFFNNQVNPLYQQSNTPTATSNLRSQSADLKKGFERSGMNYEYVGKSYKSNTNQDNKFGTENKESTNENNKGKEKEKNNKKET
ncbi:MAG: hypothetical protein EZS28_005727 [Streblomastix strix]|uniref:Uncharacterized protein n=1 Tax=Streblomastix strix TaxID=222440 RepID=A0A5J4WVC5_9EUKA|nr:MAG: hypothetical protein EZS28_005727 [Streblomastix strix]